MAPSVLPCMPGPLGGWREVGDAADKTGGGRRKAKDTKEAASKDKSPPPPAAVKKGMAVEDDMTEDGKLSPRSDDSSSTPESVVLDPFDTDSMEDLEEFDYREEDISFVKSFSYGTIAGSNLVIEGALPFHRDDIIVDEATGNVISIHSWAAPEGGLPKPSDDQQLHSSSSDSDQPPAQQPSMRSLLSWRKRKLSFRSPRSRGEPLLNKAYGEDGGDEIDWDRRMSGSRNDELALQKWSNDGSAAAVGDLVFSEGLFSVGKWEHKEVESRDRHLKLATSVFFASFDQRSESAAGESACTALVAVIADWLHRYPTLTPSKAEFDMLIRDGSAEWRKLCEVESYKDRFPDRHFDLDTVLQAAVRPLAVVAQKSFIGFFKPDGLADSVEFLQGAMTFDGIWEEIERAGPAVYIVSWNDHFFVLKVEESAYYIIDTLGERLYEGCSQAYILQFDDRSSLCQLKPEAATETTKTAAAAAGGGAPAAAAAPAAVAAPSAVAAAGAPTAGQQQAAAATASVASAKNDPSCKAEVVAAAADSSKENGGGSNETGKEVAVVAGTSNPSDTTYSGKKACCEFVKGFFAALPLRELENDIKRGLLGKVSLHQRLQIEFHYTAPVGSPCMDLMSL